MRGACFLQREVLAASVAFSVLRGWRVVSRLLPACVLAQ
jgi:hypothetical protein